MWQSLDRQNRSNSSSSINKHTVLLLTLLSFLFVFIYLMMKLTIWSFEHLGYFIAIAWSLISIITAYYSTELLSQLYCINLLITAMVISLILLPTILDLKFKFKKRYYFKTFKRRIIYYMLCLLIVAWSVSVKTIPYRIEFGSIIAFTLLAGLMLKLVRYG